MRYIVATAAMMLVAAQFASARGESADTANPNPRPPANLNTEGPVAKTTEELKKKVEEVGFKDVQVIPHMFVVVAKKPDGQNVSMIVDALTLQALQLGGDDAEQGGDEPQHIPEGACKPPSGEPL